MGSTWQLLTCRCVPTLNVPTEILLSGLGPHFAAAVVCCSVQVGTLRAKACPFNIPLSLGLGPACVNVKDLGRAWGRGSTPRPPIPSRRQGRGLCPHPQPPYPGPPSYVPTPCTTHTVSRLPSSLTLHTIHHYGGCYPVITGEDETTFWPFCLPHQRIVFAAGLTPSPPDSNRHIPPTVCVLCLVAYSRLLIAQPVPPASAYFPALCALCLRHGPHFSGNL